MDQEDQLVESFSGIRGIYGKSLTDEVARRYALVYGDYLKNKFKNEKTISVVIGGDPRKSTNILKDIFIWEFLNLGFRVIDVEIASTPMVEFGVRAYKAQGGLVVTASHNEPEFNGWKLLQESGAVLGVGDINRLIKRTRTRMSLALIKAGESPGKGCLVKRGVDLERRYVRDILKIIGKKAVTEIRQNHFKVVADLNGGPAITVAKRLARSLNFKLVGVNMQAGVFGRMLTPNAETLKYLIPLINKEKAQFGFGLDGDADRMEMILPDSDFTKVRGNLVSGHYTVALGVDFMLRLKGGQGEKVVVNLPTAHLVHEVARKYGARIIETDVGETNVVTKMEKFGSLVGGEGSSSGLIVSPDRCRDGVLSVAVALAMMASRKKPLAEILADYPEYFEKREYVSCRPGADLKIKNCIIKHYQRQGQKVKKAPGKTGGVKVLFDDYHWLFFRGSQTEPGIFRIIANGKDRVLVDKMIEEGKEVFKKFS